MEADRLIQATQPNDEIVVGDCPTGLDAFVRANVGDKRMLWVAHAPWGEHGAIAGPMRNRAMARRFHGEDVSVWAFPERDEVARGSGTWDAVRAFESAFIRPTVFGDFKRLEKR